jgi:hypothetical protein
MQLMTVSVSLLKAREQLTSRNKIRILAELICGIVRVGEPTG